MHTTVLKLQADFLAMTDPMAQMTLSLKEFSTEFVTLEKKVADDKVELKSEIDELRQTVAELIGRVDKIGSTVTVHDYDISSLNEAESMGLSLTINGIPKNEDESLKEIFANIASKIGFVETPHAHLFRLNVNSPAPTIIARFDSLSAKNKFKFNFMEVAKTLLVNRIAGFEGSPPDARIYIQDLMSKETYNLHKAAVKFKKEKKIVGVIIEQSKIFIKIKKDDKKTRVYNIGHLEKIIKHTSK